MSKEELFASATAAAAIQLEIITLGKDCEAVGPMLNMITGRSFDVIKSTSIAIDKLAACRDVILQQGPEGSHELYSRIIQKHGLSPS